MVRSRPIWIGRDVIPGKKVKRLVDFFGEPVRDAFWHEILFFGQNLPLFKVVVRIGSEAGFEPKTLNGAILGENRVLGLFVCCSSIPGEL